MSHHRVAAGYLRTGNIDLARLEIDGLREAWAKVSTLPRPAAFRDQERYTGTILTGRGAARRHLAGAQSRPRRMSRANRSTRSARSLSDLRRENGVTVLADCVLDANVAMDALFATDRGAGLGERRRRRRVLYAPRCGAATAWRRAASAITPSFAA